MSVANMDKFLNEYLTTVDMEEFTLEKSPMSAVILGSSLEKGPTSFHTIEFTLGKSQVNVVIVESPSGKALISLNTIVSYRRKTRCVF